MRVVHLNQQADTQKIDREVTKQMIEKFLKRDQRRLNKKYKLDGNMESSGRLPRLRG